MDTAKRFITGATLFSAAVISIGFSSWQFQNDDGGISWTPSWNDICTSFPNDMLRPISVTISDKTSYCGYSNGNTGYRLTVAIITLIFSVGIFLQFFEERQMILNAIYWSLYSLWFLASGLDIVAVANGQAACNDSLTSLSGSSSTCSNSVYGISIAIDIAICFVIAGFIYLQVKRGGVSGGGGGAAAAPRTMDNRV